MFNRGILKRSATQISSKRSWIQWSTTHDISEKIMEPIKASAKLHEGYQTSLLLYNAAARLIQKTETQVELEALNSFASKSESKY